MSISVDLWTYDSESSENMEVFKSFEVFSSNLHGDGVKAKENILQGTILFKEKPLHHLQSLPNKQDVLVCSACLRFLGPIDLQIQYLTKKTSRYDIINLSSRQNGNDRLMVGCNYDCGELYCSYECRDKHWHKCHNLLCTGRVSELDAAISPLIAFKQHAVQSNEIFLLCGDVLASICNSIDSNRHNGLDLHGSIQHSLSLYQTYVRMLWWDAAVAPPGTKPKMLVKSLKKLVQESYGYINSTLQLQDRELDEVLSSEFLARMIGMFEQNNVGIRLQSPVASMISNLKDDAVIAKLHDLVTSIATQLNDEDMEDCDDEDCDEDEEDEDEEMDEADVDNQELQDMQADQPDEPIITTESTSHHKSALDGLLELIDEEGGMDRIFPPLDGTAFYKWICKINHSCDPNVMVKYNISERLGLHAEVVALRDIAEGEELLQSYIDQLLPYELRQKSLKDYGFRCTCTKCLYDESKSLTLILG